LGAELVRRPTGWAYRFGAAQLNLHGPGFHPAEVARLPVAPGNSDLCFEWRGAGPGAGGPPSSVGGSAKGGGGGARWPPGGRSRPATAISASSGGGRSLMRSLILRA